MPMAIDMHFIDLTLEDMATDMDIMENDLLTQNPKLKLTLPMPILTSTAHILSDTLTLTHTITL